MQNSEYWKIRFGQLEEAQNRLGLQCYAEIEDQYRRAQRQLEAQISTWYQRFADNNGITLAEARRMLTGRELEELKWDVRQYIKYGEENVLNQQWMRQLENASARYHISRLEALKLHTQQSLEALFGNQLDTIDAAMKGIYTNGYYHTAFEIQKGAGVAWDFAALDDKKIRKVINRPWAADGKNFSERVWQNRQKLVSELNTELTQNIILGQDPRKAIDAIAKKMGTSKSNAGRLVMTEEAFFSSAAQRDCFSELGVEQYEIVATLDSNTSEICQEMDGKVFPMSQWEAGVTAPPFHVRCRTTTVPTFGDEFDSIGERAARDPETGKTCYVPTDMTYPEWKEKYVDKAGQADASQDKAPQAKTDANMKHESQKKAIVDGEKSGLKEAAGGKIYFMDVTNEWIKNKGIKGSIVERNEYIVDGISYAVDGKYVVLRPTTQEREIADVLGRKYGKDVEFVPQVMFPQGVQTPDYLIDGERFDLKSPIGSGKNLLYGLIAKKQRQSHNFIIDATNCPLSMEELEKQAEDLYRSPRTGFLNLIVFMKNGDVVKVLSRK